MNTRDAAGIAYPFREQPLDPPEVAFDDDAFAKFKAHERERLVAGFLAKHDDSFDEYCMDQYDYETRFDRFTTRADLELDAEKEAL